MAKWKEIKWGDLATLEYGKGLQDYLREDGKFPVYGTNGKIGTTDSYICSFPSIVIGRKGAYRGVHYSSTPFYVIDTAFYLKPKTDDLDMKYAYYQLLTVDINSMDSGSAIPSTSREDFYDIDILFPSLPEQRSIASILSSLDDKIDLLHSQNKTLEASAETLFRQWFIEEAEKYDRIELGKIAEVGTGKGLKREEFKEEGDYPILGANGEIGRTNKFLTDERLILTGRVGTLGKVYINEDKSWISDNVLVVKPIDELLFYPIYFTLKRLDFENLNVGSTQPLVTQTDLKTIVLTLPSDELRNEFANQCSVYFEKRSKNKQQIRTLTQLRDTLLPKLMSGKVRVKIE